METSSTVTRDPQTQNSKEFPCQHCSETFKKLFNLKRHVERFHVSTSEVPDADLNSGYCACQSCPFKCHRVADLRKHLSEDHNMTFDIENLTFNSQPEFLQWKMQQEENENCLFVKSTGDKHLVKEGTQVQYFQCSRSGISREVDSPLKKRRRKSQGSSKINSNCTASLTAKVSLSGQVEVSICHTHYGHDTSLEHLRLSTTQREIIAAKLQQGVSRERILDDIREDFPGGFQRQHLIERQDIVNIERAYGLKTVQRHENDQQSTLAWIEEWKQTDQNPVLFVKLQDEDAMEGYDLAKEDFLMVVQTPFQQEMLIKFAEKGICCDSTHGTNGYDFPLTTIHVIDDFGQGIPVAFCLSNHEDFTSIVIFFNEIKKRCGNIESQCFMSDMANQYYNAWVAVMDEVPRPKKLLCTWHVDKAWKGELKKKVGDDTVESDVYKMLRTCLEQTTQSGFEDCLSGLLQRLESNPKTKMFHTYFAKEWVSKKEQWAFCFRLESTMNTNMFSEAFHRVFKRVYLKGLVNKRVDVCLVNLVKFSRDKAFDRAIKLTKGKTTYRTSVIASRHKESLKIGNESVLCPTNETGNWFVLSGDGEHNHEVVMLSSFCTEASQCQMVCPDCKVCSHMFQCNCPDWLVVGTICKHIHAVWRQASSSSQNQPEARSDKSSKAELESLSTHLKNVSHADPSSIKECIKEKIFSINSEISACDNVEALSALEKQLGVALSNFVAVKNHGCTPANLSPSCNSPANRAMETQRSRFHSTKRKCRSRTASRFARPTIEEKDMFFHILSSASDGNGPSQLKPISIAQYEMLQVLVTPTTLKLLTTAGKLIDVADLTDEELPGEFLVDEKLKEIEGFFSKDAWSKLQMAVKALKVSWTCTSCKVAQYKEMIACDHCGNWYHWCCVGVKEEPEAWLCCACNTPNKSSLST